MTGRGNERTPDQRPAERRLGCYDSSVVVVVVGKAMRPSSTTGKNAVPKPETGDAVGDAGVSLFRSERSKWWTSLTEREWREQPWW